MRLTRLCEYGLGGNGYGLFVCCIDGKDASLPDTMHGMDMCERVRKIKMHSHQQQEHHTGANQSQHIHTLA